MQKAYKFRIYPNQEQRILIEKHFGCVRWVYNMGLTMKIKAWKEEKKTIYQQQTQAVLPALKKATDTAWLGEVNAQSLQNALKNVDAAYTGFFRNGAGFPKFKSKHKSRPSFQCPQYAVPNFEAGTISLPKLKNIKCIFDRTFEGKVGTTTISRTPTNQYYVSFLVDDGKEEPKKQPFDASNTIGVDLGLIDFVTLSSGEKVANPKHYKKTDELLRKRQSRADRKVKGSNNRHKARLKVNRLHQKTRNQRKDFLHKLSTRLIRENQAVAVEDLNVEGMMKNHCLARSVGSAGWSEFIRMLKYKAKWYGKTVLTIGRFEPSSKLCTCGVINRNLDLSDRVWRCASCGVIHDRDILAASNIKDFALHPQNSYRAGCARVKA